MLSNPNDDLSLFRVLSLLRLGIGKETIKILSLYAQEKEISFFQSMQSCCKTYPEYQKYMQEKDSLLHEIESTKQDFEKIQFGPKITPSLILNLIHYSL